MPGAQPPSPSDVRHAAEVSRTALLPLVDRDWHTPAGDLEVTARQALEHVVETLAFYARDLATPVLGPAGDDELVLKCAPATPVTGLLDGMEQLAAVLAGVVSAVPTDRRAYHGFGMADPTGFAAMACDEILIHTDDIAAGLDAGFDPPDELCERVVTRLFPWAPTEGPAWDRLRWANGRIALPDRPRQGPDWRWHCAPLEEWDGSA